MGYTFGRRQLVVHQHRERAVLVVERAEAVWHTDHTVCADRITRRNDRLHGHGGVGRDDVGSRRGDVPGLEGLNRKTDLPHGAAIGFRARHSKPTLPGHGAVLLVMTISVRQTRWNARSVRMTV